MGNRKRNDNKVGTERKILPRDWKTSIIFSIYRVSQSTGIKQRDAREEVEGIKINSPSLRALSFVSL